jgi:Family of unknown function (DUF6353)
MNNTKWLNSISKFTKDNSPTLLSGAAIGGVIATAYLAARATPKALEKLYGESWRKSRGEEKPSSATDGLTKKEIVQTTWRFYLPAGLSGAATIACIVGANRIDAKRYAALGAAYALADTSFREYKDKVLEQIGKTKEQKVRDEIAKDKLEKDPPKDGTIILTSGGETLCYDQLTGRYFRGDIEAIRKAENEINRRAITDQYSDGVPHNDFYELLGLGNVLLGDELGWNVEHMLEIVYSSHLSEKGEPCLSIGYRNLPKKDYNKLY